MTHLHHVARHIPTALSRSNCLTWLILIRETYESAGAWFYFTCGDDWFICDNAHSHATWFIMWRNSFMLDIRIYWRMIMFHMHHFTCTISSAPWLIHTRRNSLLWNMTHSYIARLIHVWHDSFILCGMTHSCKIYDCWRLIIVSYAPWLNRVWLVSFIYDMTHSQYVARLIHAWHTHLLALDYVS